MIQAGLVKVLWMVIRLNGDIEGVFLDEPVPENMTHEECVISAVMQQRRDSRKGVTYRCEWHYGKPPPTGKFFRMLE